MGTSPVHGLLQSKPHCCLRDQILVRTLKQELGRTLTSIFAFWPYDWPLAVKATHDAMVGLLSTLMVCTLLSFQ